MARCWGCAMAPWDASCCSSAAVWDGWCCVGAAMPEGFLVGATDVPRLLAPVAAGAAGATVRRYCCACDPRQRCNPVCVASAPRCEWGLSNSSHRQCSLSSSCLQIFPSGLCWALSQSSLSWRISVRLVPLVTRYFAGANNNFGSMVTR